MDNIQQPAQIPSRDRPPHHLDSQRSINIFSLLIFKKDSALKALIDKYARTTKISYSLAEVMTIIIHSIISKEMYDKTNIPIISCSKELGEALGVRALHLLELKRAVLSKVIQISNGKPAIIHLPEEEIKPTVHEFLKRASEFDKYQHKDHDNWCELNSPLLHLLRKLPNFPNQGFLPVHEVKKFIDDYISSRGTIATDQENKMILHIKNDPLGKIFGVDKFHRMQTYRLISTHVRIINNKDSSSQTDAFEKNDLHETVKDSGYHETSLHRRLNYPELNQTRISDSPHSRPSARETHVTIATDQAYTQGKDSLTCCEEIMDTSDEEMYEGEYEINSSQDDERPCQANGRGLLYSSTNNSDSEIHTLLELSKKELAPRPIEPLSTPDCVYTSTSGYDEVLGIPVPEFDKCSLCHLNNESKLPICQKCWTIRRRWIKNKKSNKQKNLHESFNTSTKTYHSTALQRNNSKVLCRNCNDQEPDGRFIHKKSAHQGYCYTCAKCMWKKNDYCPHCNLKIERIIRSFR